nr:2-oxo-tetronate isomerase [uncultured Enterobacter sp.]
MTEHQFCLKFRDKPVDFLANALGERLIQQHLRLTTAESCTGGQLASTLCAAKNTPDFFGYGFITFTDAAKINVLKVPRETIARHTAVSQQTVEAMARGAISASGEALSVAISGYAGPDGGEDGTPAGTVWFAWYFGEDEVRTRCRQFTGDCTEVIDQAIRYAIAMLICRLDEIHE